MNSIRPRRIALSRRTRSGQPARVRVDASTHAQNRQFRPRGFPGRPNRESLDRRGQLALLLFSVSHKLVPGGVVHKLPADLRAALLANATALAAWTDITPLARNEFICWVEDAKQEPTRKRRIRRTEEELEEGKRRPCCWPGCKHRE